MTLSAGLRLWSFALVLNSAAVSGAAAAMTAQAEPVQAPLASRTVIGLADSAGLRATVFGTPPQDMAALPAKVPLSEINVKLPWRLPVPKILWFDAKLRVWLSAQGKPAPLAIVISGTGSDGNTKTISVLRAALYGAGYHVLTLPSPTFPGFIVAASSTGVAGDLMRDGKDLYAAMQEIVAHLPRKLRITDVDLVGYSLGAANAAIVKSLDAAEHKLNIHRVVMINPPVSLFSSIGRLDKLFAATIGPGEGDVELLYRRLYAQIANLYRASDRLELDEDFLLGAAAATLKTDADFSAAIALTFRLQLVDMFFIGDLYAKTGVITDPSHPPKLGDSLEDIQRDLRAKPFADYFARVFAPYYLKRRPDATGASLIASNRLDIIADALRSDGDYYAQTTRNDLILNQRELAWLQDTLGPRIVVYDQGGHLGEIGDRHQVADMLDMLSGGWPRSAQ
jgi:pimeloyl-ACP methyl ester carboxylesterase